jgi:hypothetical protein
LGSLGSITNGLPNCVPEIAGSMLLQFFPPSAVVCIAPNVVSA